MIIHVHAHYTTSPPALQGYRGLQMATLNRSTVKAPKISDEEIAVSLQQHWEHMRDSDWLSQQERDKILYANVLRIFPRLGERVGSAVGSGATS